MPQNENQSKDKAITPFLHQAIAKLDSRPEGHAGYITAIPELQGILNELIPSVSVAILEKSRGKDFVSVEIKLNFTVSRFELGIK